MIRIAGQPSRLAVDKRPVSPITGRELRNRMSPYQRHVLAWMRLAEDRDKKAEHSADEVWKAVGRTPNATGVIPVLGALEERGYVKRTGRPARKARWHVTPAGWAAP